MPWVVQILISFYWSLLSKTKQFCPSRSLFQWINHSYSHSPRVIRFTIDHNFALIWSNEIFTVVHALFSRYPTLQREFRDFSILHRHETSASPNFLISLKFVNLEDLVRGFPNHYQQPYLQLFINLKLFDSCIFCNIITLYSISLKGGACYKVIVWNMVIRPEGQFAAEFWNNLLLLFIYVTVIYVTVTPRASTHSPCQTIWWIVIVILASFDIWNASLIKCITTFDWFHLLLV